MRENRDSNAASSEHKERGKIGASETETREKERPLAFFVDRFLSDRRRPLLSMSLSPRQRESVYYRATYGPRRRTRHSPGPRPRRPCFFPFPAGVGKERKAEKKVCEKEQSVFFSVVVLDKRPLISRRSSSTFLSSTIPSLLPRFIFFVLFHCRPSPFRPPRPS